MPALKVQSPSQLFIGMSCDVTPKVTGVLSLRPKSIAPKGNRSDEGLTLETSASKLFTVST